MSPMVTLVEAIVEPYNRTHDRYQSYYRNSISTYCSGHGIPFRETGSRFPRQLRFLYRVRASDRFRKLLPWLGTRMIDGIATTLGAARGPEHALGTYVFHSGKGDVKVCVDAQDSGDIEHKQVLEWSDIYFKTNFWPTREYPRKVMPMANLNPLVLSQMKFLREARNTPKEWDLFAFFRVWGGTDEVEGVEHNLALFETLARVKCKKKLLAFLVSGDIRAAAARLEKAGVPWTTEWMPLPELWDLAARSRLNVVRHGMHQCIPWRMTDILAMGGCPVLDYAATTRWHAPLEENVHYLNLGVPYRPSGAAPFDPDEVVDRVEDWIAHKTLIGDMEQATANYFDQHLSPENLGRYILEKACQAG